MTLRPFTIIIPAHNEENMIGHCLETLFPDESTPEYQVIVIANACEDNTAEVARSFPLVEVIDTKRAGKPNAFNLGDKAAKHFPRIYLDADIQLKPDAARAVANVLANDEALVAAPKVEFNLNGCNWLVRQYYAIWTQMPYFRQNMVGSGVFALSQKGREEFNEWPEIISDDGFILHLFSPSERKSVTEHTFTVYPPKKMKSLLRIKTRSRYGLYQLRRRFTPHPEQRVSFMEKWWHLLKNPCRWPGVPVFILAGLWIRIAARYRVWKFGVFDIGQIGWDKDHSSRRIILHQKD